MRLEALVSVGHYRPANLVHVVLDNGMHESTGGQPSLSATVSMPAAALACGYATAVSVNESARLGAHVRRALSAPGPHFLHVRVLPGSLEPLGRPTIAPAQVKERFMAFLRE
jgi:phosphonopyruvate decarboxylase